MIVSDPSVPRVAVAGSGAAETLLQENRGLGLLVALQFRVKLSLSSPVKSTGDSTKAGSLMPSLLKHCPLEKQHPACWHLYLFRAEEFHWLSGGYSACHWFRTEEFHWLSGGYSA